MKLSKIAEDEYEGLEDTDEFEEAPIPAYEPDENMIGFIQDGQITGGNLTPHIDRLADRTHTRTYGQSRPGIGISGGNRSSLSKPGEKDFLHGITGEGRFVFPVYSEHVDDVNQLFEQIKQGDPNDWTGEFQHELRNGTINAVLRKAGEDESMDDDWRMDMEIKDCGWEQENLAYIIVTFR